MIYCLNPTCPHPQNPEHNAHCQYCGVPIALRNRFKASKLLGQGGFGKTYLAQDLDNRNKPCVIKRLTYKGADAQSTEKARQLFEQEAERLDQLVHPQIPRLLAYFQEASYLYLVQEVIEGETLQEELQKDGPFSEAKIKAVLEGLLPVLQFVHSHSVIHRDLKPDNIMRRRNGELVLIDFGVAKFLEQSGFSQTATTIGTPGYAAPEQISGRVTPASDLFGLGATCFQLMTRGFDTGSVSTVGYNWTKNWAKYVSYPVSAELNGILSKLIATDERNRYPTATAVLRDLQGRKAATMPHAQTASSIKTVAVAPGTPQIQPIGSAVVQPPAVQPPAGQPPAIQPPAGQTPTPHNQAPYNQAPYNQAPYNQAPYNQTPQSPKPLKQAIHQQNYYSPNHSPVPPAVQGFAAPTTLSQNTQNNSAPATSRKRVPVSGGFWIKYGLFTHVSQIIGFVIAMVITAVFAISVHPDPGNITDSELSSMLNLLYWMHWPVAGFFVGFAQWLAIKKWLPRALWWMPATVASFWAIALAIATGYTGGLSGFVFGGMVGLPQWLAMRNHTPRASWWLGWMVAFTVVLFYAMSTGAGSTLGWLVLAPLLDGLVLSWILRQQTPPSRGVDAPSAQSAH
ncbi:MAG: protein kinase [Cyanobacteria bacterium J06643_4]